jgi:hypothetical protein
MFAITRCLGSGARRGEMRSVRGGGRGRGSIGASLSSMRMGTEEDFGSLKGLRANEKEVRRRRISI